jgi:glycosyltransferase involved in cell wall biosynthesis
MPSYNESRAIGAVIKSIVRMGMTVLVIDDGSIDNTERVALDNGAIVLRHKQNLGKGYSLREGIRHVIEKMNFEWMIMMDADGQHHPEDIPALMSATRGGDVDMVIGNRMLQTKTMPSARYWTNRFMSWMISGICKQRIPDTQCGFRLLKVGSLEKLKLTSEKYDIESEMLIQAAQKGLKIASAPIQTIYGDEISKIHPVHDTIRFIKLIFTHHLYSDEVRRAEKTDDR